MTKIAVSCCGQTLDDQVDPRFGRAFGFLVVDPETREVDFLANDQAAGMARGAGIQAAESLARAGVGTVLTGFVGPKAVQVLSAAGIRVGQGLDGLTARQAVEKLRAGAVAFSDRPSSPGRRP